jgi:hypothetical protein
MIVDDEHELAEQGFTYEFADQPPQVVMHAAGAVA